VNRLRRWLLPAVLVLLVLTVLIGSIIRQLPVRLAADSLGDVIDTNGEGCHVRRIDSGEHTDSQLIAA
jgi:hypothetical protein